MNMPPLRDLRTVHIAFMKMVRRLIQTDAEG
jgi:hypothetical protein